MEKRPGWTIFKKTFNFSDLQPRRAGPREVGARDGEGVRQRQTLARRRLHVGRQNQRRERQQPRLRQSKLRRPDCTGRLGLLNVTLCLILKTVICVWSL